MDSYKKSLVDSGLTENQAGLYELLIKNGGLRASSIVRQLGNSLSRPMVYAVLHELLELGLVEKNEIDTKVARFIPAHPTKLQDIAESRRIEADTIAQSASAIIPRIVSDYNLISGKPGVRFFEGDVGIKAVLSDSLNTESEIYSYADLESVQKYIPTVNNEYVLERERRNIKKKVIMLDTQYNQKYIESYHEKITDIKLIKYDAKPFESVMQIYDNKISYLTLSPTQKIGVIIDDPQIYHMHRYLFEYLWSITSELMHP